MKRFLVIHERELDEISERDILIGMGRVAIRASKTARDILVCGFLDQATE